MTFWPGCYKDWKVLSNRFTIQWISIRETKKCVNPLSPNSDQQQFSPNNIHTLS